MRVEIAARSAAIALSLLAICVPTNADEIQKVVAADAQPKKIVGDCKFTEGPAYGPQGFLLFSDIPNSRIIKVTPDGAASDFMKPSGKSNGLMFDAGGLLYACQGGARQVVRIDPNDDNKVTVLADSYDGKRLNSPNDLALDASGGIYFTDPRYGSADDVEQPVMGVYYIDASGKVTRVIDDLKRPNGILVSPDGRSLYVANPDLRQLFRYEIAGPGKLGKRTLLFTGDKEKDGGGPDGMALDELGNLYTTYKGIVVLGPDGKLIGRVNVPEHPANCAFGGTDNKTLYITARTSLYALPMRVKGMALQKGSLSSAPSEGKTRTVTARALTLAVPTSWKQQEAANRMRAAQFVIPAAPGDKERAELVVYYFGKQGAGGVQANVQRWIGQFSPKERKVKVTEGASKQGNYTLVDVQGLYNKTVGPPISGKTRPLPGARMLAAVLETDDGHYFLKFTGPEKTVTANATPFRASFGARGEDEKPQQQKRKKK